MHLFPVLVPLFLLFFTFTSFTETSADQDDLITQVSINCGSSGTSALINGKEWIGDIKPRKSSMLQIKGSSTTSTPINKKSTSINPDPYNTARISRSKFSYALKLNPGQIMLRLHFNSASYKGFKGSRDLFSVEAGSFILLSNFSASLEAEAHEVNTFKKEFCLSIQENQELDIIFSPIISCTSQDSTYAFINGVEIIPIPVQLFYFGGGDLDDTTALELVHRVSVKRDFVPVGDDSDYMLGTWRTVQTQKTNGKENLTCKKSVDVGFRYLVRILFSELELKKSETSGLIFKVLINERVVDSNTEIVAGRDGHGSMWFRDYKVMINGRKQEGKRAISISLQSNDENMDGRRFLEGFEIYKLSNPDNSLASPNALPAARNSPSGIIKSLQLVFSQRNATATVAIAILTLLDIILYMLQQIRKSSDTEDENKPSARAKRICRRFSLEEIWRATKNFSDAFLIGRGGFGKVYRGLIDDGQQTVAIKRLKESSSQGKHEFLTEIETLSELRHVNLVSLIGYCNERREMILVYEYMHQGTLADQIHKLSCDSNNCSLLTWKQLLNICIGAGRGLDYLHTGCGVIHRDVKTSNILLDENFVPKVSDFGLAKPEDKLKLKSHVSTKVKGTRGYLDPCYYSTGKLTRKSDIYAFGVVLMEVLCVRSAVEPMLGEDAYYLHKWARNKINKGEIEGIIAPILKEEVSPNSLKVFIGVAERCLHDDPKERPTMAQVVLQLEFALEQQDSWKRTVPNETVNAAATTDASPLKEENIASSSTEQQKEASSAVESASSPSEKPTNREVNNNGHPAVKKEKKQKAHTRLWPRTFWNWPKLFKEKPRYISDFDFFGVEINLPRYDLATITAATNKLSPSNEIGEGRFDIVLEAVLPTGQRVAIQDFSFSCQEKLEEFKRTILRVHHLHHPNIIKLLGYCIHDKGGMILYEFMESQSLNTFIFDGHLQQLQWPQCFKIIMGIAKAVVYLHHDSGLTHRDLKPSNILLDVEMNPKLSGFGLMRTLEHINDTVFSTTFLLDYPAPEHIMGEALSTKADVYSFGVVVLEVLSGRKHRDTVYRADDINLIEYAWKLWNEGQAIDLVYESLGRAYSVDEALRCIQVSVLCTQTFPSHRPEMSSVLKMLLGEDSSLQDKVEEAASHPHGLSWEGLHVLNSRGWKTLEHRGLLVEHDNSSLIVENDDKEYLYFSI